MRRDRAIVDDAAALQLLPPHDAKSLARTEERAGEIDIDDRLPFLERDLVELRGGAPHAGVIESRSTRPCRVVVTSKRLRTDSSSVTSVGTGSSERSG